MTKFAFTVANITFSANVLFESTKKYCSAFIDYCMPKFAVEISLEDIAREREIAAREDALEGLPVRQLSDALLERTALQRKIVEKLFYYNTLLFHGSAVAVDGQAYLFTAKSGTGKSTHTRLWRELLGDRAVMVNDDKPFLRITDLGTIVYGSPWNGKHGLGNNICAPLKAICILERGKENRIQRIPAGEAVFMLLQQSARPTDPAQLPLYMQLLDQLAGQVAFYKLSCNMDAQAAALSYQTMSEAPS